MIKVRKEAIAGLIPAIALIVVQSCIHKPKCNCLSYKEVKLTTIYPSGDIKFSKDSICVSWENDGSIKTLNLK